MNKRKREIKNYSHYNAIAEIKNIISAGTFIAENIVDRARVAYFFALIRKIIDCLYSDKEREKYSLLYFYSTWSLHVDMDRNPVCIEKIKKINQIMIDHKNNPDLRAILTKALSLDIVLQQINELIFLCMRTHKPILGESIWEQIKPILLELISTAPLIDKSSELFLKEISVVVLPGQFFGLYNLPIDKPIFGFKILTKDLNPGVFLGVAIANKINNTDHYINGVSRR